MDVVVIYLCYTDTTRPVYIFTCCSTTTVHSFLMCVCSLHIIHICRHKSVLKMPSSFLNHKIATSSSVFAFNELAKTEDLCSITYTQIR